MKSESLTQRIAAWPVRLKEYVEELRTEMRRVTWPSWKQVRSTTLVVIVAVFAFAGYFAIVDTFLGHTIGRVFDAFTR
jgi:preprotein translocase subunit SecE